MTSTDLSLSAFYADSTESGLIVTQDTGLNGDISAGVVYINQTQYSIDAVTGHTFTVSVDTYVDVGNDGTIDYNEVVIDNPAPALAANHIRLAMVRTDGSAITAITDLRTITEAFAFGTVTLSGTAMTIYNAGTSVVYYRHGTASTSVGIPISPRGSVTVDETVYVKPTSNRGALIVTQ